MVSAYCVSMKPEFNAQDPSEMLSKIAHSCKFSAGAGGHRQIFGVFGLVTSQPTCELQVSERTYLKKQVDGS